MQESPLTFSRPVSPYIVRLCHDDSFQPAYIALRMPILAPTTTIILIWIKINDVLLCIFKFFADFMKIYKGKNILNLFLSFLFQLNYKNSNNSFFGLTFKLWDSSFCLSRSILFLVITSRNDLLFHAGYACFSLNLPFCLYGFLFCTSVL